MGGTGQETRRGSLRARRRLAAACLAGCLAIGIAAAARAADAPVDTELTPVPKTPAQWAVLAGAKYDQGGKLIDNSPTPFTVDFFTTSFSPDYQDTDHPNPVGFFGGAQCIDANTPFDKLEGPDGCERRPAIYRYSLNDAGDPQIDHVSFPGKGYVGAIAWIGGQRALAVGGTGSYPRREPVCQPSADNPCQTDADYLRYDEEHWAGMARAWLYDPAHIQSDNGWRELKNLPDPATGFTGQDGDELPNDMGGLTGLDCAHEDGDDVKAGTCVSGGMQRLWWWRPTNANTPEGFREPSVAPADVAGIAGPDFHFRVRQIRANGGSFQAVTSGCCQSTGDGSNAVAQVGWGARVLTCGDASCSTWSSKSASAGGAEDAIPRDGSFADSYFSFLGGAVLAAPGGAPSPGSDESGSRIFAAPVANGGPTDLGNNEATTQIEFRGLRLVAGDGDFVAPATPYGLVFGENLNRGEGVPDWIVGCVKQGCEHGDAEGVAYTTADEILPLPIPLDCPINVVGIATAVLLQNPPACAPVPSKLTDYKAPPASRRLLGMGTYPLNSIQFVPGTGGASAWAAGDRGALARLGGAGALGAEAEPPAPRLGAPRPTSTSDEAPFAPTQPGLSSHPGTVPELATRPLRSLARPMLVPYGTPDPTRPASDLNANASNGGETFLSEGISSIAMNRDGSDGWAVGPGQPFYHGTSNYPTTPRNPAGDRLTLNHFDGERWVSCAPDGVGGIFSPDPACSSLAPLLQVKQGGVSSPPSLSAIARIPVERDGDPTNDDDFEAVAVGTPINGSGDGSNGPATVIDYRAGRWSIDEQARRNVSASQLKTGAQYSVVFTRPDDGWMIPGPGAHLYHYGGGNWPNGRWVDCEPGPPSTPPSECGGQSVLNVPAAGGAAGPELQLQLAGYTVFIAGTRQVASGSGQSYPLVMSKESGGPWMRDYDPACPDPNAEGGCQPQAGAPVATGRIAFSVTELGDGHIAGWLLLLNYESSATSTVSLPIGNNPVLIRRDPTSGEWATRSVDDAAGELIPAAFGTSGASHEIDPRLISLTAADGTERSFVIPGVDGGLTFGHPTFPPLEFDRADDRWRVMPAPFVSNEKFGHLQWPTEGDITAAGPDNAGGLWIAGTQSSPQSSNTDTATNRGQNATFYYHYTTERPEPVFKDVSSPVQGPITGMAGTPAGAVWVSTESDRIYNYRRATGWRMIRIRGWDKGRVVARPSRSFAVAVNDAEIGLVVGEKGRIADISPNEVQLDPASFNRCSQALAPPCGTPRDLRAAAVAPDGSAIVGGDHLTLEWRPAGEGFRLIERPRASINARITGLAMPSPGAVWLSTDMGEIWAGTLASGRWSWVRESAATAAADERRSRFFPRGRSVLNAIAVDASGRGLAVGDRGAMLERVPDGTWIRLDTGFLDDLYSVALPPGGKYGDGTLVGGGVGLILTRQGGQFHLARPSDITDPLTTNLGQLRAGRIIGVTNSGGPHDGDVEAWASSQISPVPDLPQRDPLPWAMLHFASSNDPLLNPERRAEALPDASLPQPGEVTLAAFGRSECQLAAGDLGNNSLQHYCTEMEGSNLFNETVTRAIASSLRERQQAAQGPLAAVFTGDISSFPGRSEQRGFGAETPLTTNVLQNQWRELFADPLARGGVPLFAVPGKTDLSRGGFCPSTTSCTDTQRLADAGLSTQWRQTFADEPAPWGSAAPYNSDGVTYRPVTNAGVSAAGRNASTSVDAPQGGAHTHYALDVVQNGQPRARLVFIDDSFEHSLSASDPDQNPIEAKGGQANWLDDVLGGRPQGEPAVVVENTPTYAYDTTASNGGTAIEADASVLEAILLKDHVSAVIAGRLGWNGLYYTLAPGLHWPCPGGSYPSRPPSTTDALDCTQAAGEAPKPPQLPATDQLPPQVQDALGQTGNLAGAIPNIVASSAGGKFGPDGNASGSGSIGYWHGYSVVRVRTDGSVMVEQRPVFSWVNLTGSTHILRPGQQVTLDGMGREVAGMDVPLFYDKIDSPAITHRFDLVLADQKKPWVPLLAEDASDEQKALADPGRDCQPYICVAGSTGTIDEQSGAVTAGSGSQGRTFAIALLSVGEKSATWPLVFEPRPSFHGASEPPALPTPPNPVPPQSPPAPAPAPPFNPPTLATPPTLPPLPAQTPPAPPVPPAPPNSGAAQLDLFASPPVLSVAPSISLFPPSPPVINVAPPTPARPVEKAKKVAVQSSGSDSDAKSGASSGVDLADGPRQAEGAANMTRHDPHAFTAIAHRDQASAWARDLQWGGGLTLMALVAAFGWLTVRPTPRRRTPEVPAPALSRQRRR
jgi:hypothetical protein